MAAISGAELRALAQLIDELDYYQLLEIERAVPASSVKRAYYAASRRFHPDANRALGGDDRSQLERVSRRVSEAYQVLRDPRRRKAYDQQLESGENRIQLVEAEAKADKQALEDHMGHTANGRRFFGLARSDIDRGDLSSALRHLKMAITFEPQNPYFKQKYEEVKAALPATPIAIGR